MRASKPSTWRWPTPARDLMQIQYDDDFVEGAVFVCVNNREHSPSPLQVRRFHREREKCYGILDPDQRNTAFFNLHLEWFREWNLERAVLAPLDEFQLLRPTLNTLVFRKALVKNDEGAELYVNPENGRAGVVALRAERFNQLDDLARFLRHEFTHLHDMVNPVFNYAPQFHLAGRNPSQQRLIRERYRLLWDITIDGRLTTSSQSTLGTREQHRSAFDRAFGFWSDAKRDDVFLALWENPQPHHDALLAIASDPRNIQSSNKPSPGAPCPLCGFATFAWAETSAFSDATAAAIKAEFPHWTPADGACQRCVAIYRLRSTPLSIA
jgi:hypothetical protein